MMPADARAYIFLNGDFLPPPDWPDQPGPSDVVIAADGGGRHVALLDWPLHFLVGDLDSLPAPLRRRFQQSGAELRPFPREKDEIDFELALDLARREGCRRIEALGALGGRWDMTLANLLLPLAMPSLAGVLFRHGPWSFFVSGGPAELTIEGREGDLISLLPLGGPALEVSLTGCRYPLNRETLKMGYSRGLSNELTGEKVSLAFAAGALMVVHQGPHFSIERTETMAAKVERSETERSETERSDR